MEKTLLAFVLWLYVCQPAFGFQEKRPEATSLFGKPLYPPSLSSDTKKQLEENLAKAEADLASDPNNLEHIIWLGRRLAYLWRYQAAIDVYTKGTGKFPNDARLYRHRGHRYISIRQFDKAITDLRKAAALIEGKRDEVEPDGQPNKLNIPTSTLHTNIYYHLALAHYLKGEFQSAVQYFRTCRDISTNDDMLCAASDWLYISLRRAGKKEEASKVLVRIHKGMNIIENFSYHKRLLMYKGELPVDSLLNLQSATDLDVATYGYGVGNWYFYSGQVAQAKEIFEKVLQGNYWAAFGNIAAEADLKRMESNR